MFISAELGICLSLSSAVVAMFAIDYPYRQVILLFKNLLFGLLVVTFCFPNPETTNILRFMGFYAADLTTNDIANIIHQNPLVKYFNNKNSIN